MQQQPPQSVEELDRRISTPTEEVVAAIAQCPGDHMVLGAGGKMGWHVCRMLRSALDTASPASRVFAVSRFGSPGATEPFQRQGIETVAADLSLPEAYANLPEVPNIVFLAGVKFGTSSSPELLERMNVTMPRLVAEHYRSSRIVALSTGCVYAFTHPQSGGSTEESPTDPPGEYARSCLGRERAFIDGSRQHGTACALIRLNYSVELRYGVLVDIAHKVLSGQSVDCTTGHVNVIWQGDAVAQILRCLPLASSPPLVLNITGPEVLSVRELAERFGQLLKRPVRLQGSEAATAWLSNSSRARELFGPPRVDIDTLTRWTADWLSAGQPLLGKPTHFENRQGSY